MSNLLQYIFGVSLLLSGIYLFVTSFKIYTPKHKTEEKAKSYENFYKKYLLLIKIASFFLILRGLYILID